ncbi:YbaN family protein [Tetragenococcus koreensis]|uniref:YbaN family protein n=1 Tax=Tetragenococcus koreensis TaxID=290335 RepID=UPI001F1C3892|nr:YbaN family protein [Tetragenococcus koreensis]MCF1616174.1 YbaN family protein [Tetragenococcus koreensis]MCF1621050.1 YbaN family protein [Tetragenococcus koreensis]MCF1627066.1 YbaN family protein [Tetragenococcus koreensis]MCF1632144.1 YbaN family protein [Tetragenococcus koreensis]MCF1676910.1 YbaN family protein [Tetragenococcus koreensis]
MKKNLLIAAGLFSFVLGSIGAILPILPTTPFLLLSGYCFARSSEQFDQWLKQTKLYKFYCADYVETRTIPRNKKWKIFINIIILMAISIFLAPMLAVKIMLGFLTVFITIFLFFAVPDKKGSKTTKQD